MRKSRALPLLVALSLSGTGTALASFLDDDIENAAFSDPLPDTTIRTNTQACINRYQDLYTLAGQYFNNLPAATSVKRIDMLVGGVPSSSGFTALELGRQHQTEYYSMRSTYGTADTKFAGIQSILQDSRDPTTATVQSLLTLTRSDGMRLVIGARHSSCDATQRRLPQSLGKSLTKLLNWTQTEYSRPSPG
ncbi:MAG: hypothetical protein KGQ59_02670 [Bdellovibrionales bacterium]|nr:hypothetical protein [Bdellovibrionales bacterium]